MRIGSVSALVLAAFALAACESGSPTIGSSASVATLDLCGLACPFGNPTSGTNVVNNPDDNDDSSTDGGNTTNLDPLTGDVTIALESSRLVKPSGNVPSLSKLTSAITTTTTTAQILGPSKPTKLTIAVDTNSGTNAAWPTPAQMDLYLYGTNAPDPTGGNNGGTDCLPDCGYREYHVYSTETGKERDESLQVWAWGNSYATQYRVTPNGGEAIQQAWSFGGNKTPVADVQSSGSATYNGRFVATAKTANYLKPSAADIDPNALWRVQGDSQVTANFGPSGTVTGTLTPETWTSFQEGISGTFMQSIGGPFVPGVNLDAPPLTPPLTITQAPHYSFYDTTIALNGTITGNTYAGTADLSGAYISGDQTMYGAFFGATGAETTGVFHVTGMDPYPVGGSAGINDDKRAYLTIQGAFNGTTP